VGLLLRLLIPPSHTQSLKEVSNTNTNNQDVAQKVCPQEKNKQDLTVPIKFIFTSPVWQVALLFVDNIHISCDATLSECYR